MGRCYYSSIRLATEAFPLMVQAACHFPSVFAPNSEQLRIVSTEVPTPVTVKKYS